MRGRFAAGGRLRGMWPPFGKTASPAIVCAGGSSGRPCCIGRTTADGSRQARQLGLVSPPRSWESTVASAGGSYSRGPSFTSHPRTWRGRYRQCCRPCATESGPAYRCCVSGSTPVSARHSPATTSPDSPTGRCSARCSRRERGRSRPACSRKRLGGPRCSCCRIRAAATPTIRTQRCCPRFVRCGATKFRRSGAHGARGRCRSSRETDRDRGQGPRAWRHRRPRRPRGQVKRMLSDPILLDRDAEPAGE